MPNNTKKQKKYFFPANKIMENLSLSNDAGVFYLPANHCKALHPDYALIVGERGTGKSLLCNNLKDIAFQKMASNYLPSIDFSKIEFQLGFSDCCSKNYPDKDIINFLLAEGASPEDIWGTIIAWIILGEEEFGIQENDPLWLWPERVRIYKKHSEAIDRKIVLADNNLADQGKKLVILFDSVDENVSTGCKKSKRLARGLLKEALEFKSFKAIRLKLFLLPNTIDDMDVIAFPDSSKLVNNIISLDWNGMDLINLLLHKMGNASMGGNDFRNYCESMFNQVWAYDPALNAWLLPEEIKTDKKIHRQVFYSISMEWLGSYSVCKNLYSWVTQKNCNEKARPLDFLLAIQNALI